MISVLVTGGENDGDDVGRRVEENDMDTQTFWQCRMEHHWKPLKRKLIFVAAKEELPIC